MEIYLNRLNQSEGVSGLCVRTYSRSKIRSSNSFIQNNSEKEKPISVFIERNSKIEKEIGKRKVEVNYHLIFDYLKGSYHVNDYLKKLRNFSYSEKELIKLARVFKDIQTTITKQNLSSIFSSQFDRTTFMEEDDHSLKISIDSNIRFYKESAGKITNFWQNHQNGDNNLEFDFPYAILEIKSSHSFVFFHYISIFTFIIIIVIKF